MDWLRCRLCATAVTSPKSGCSRRIRGSRSIPCSFQHLDWTPAGIEYVGHLVCFPYYGPASDEERAQGLSGHGEARSVEWQQVRPPQIDTKTTTFYYGAEPPKTQFRIASRSHTGRHRAWYRVRHVAVRRRAAQERGARPAARRTDVQIHRRAAAVVDNVHDLSSGKLPAASTACRAWPFRTGRSW